MALTFNTDNSGRYEAKWNFFNHVGGGTPFNDSDVERSLFINEYVYTKSKCRIVAKTVNQIQAGTNTPEARDLGEAGTEVLAISCWNDDQSIKHQFNFNFSKSEMINGLGVSINLSAC